MWIIGFFLIILGTVYGIDDNFWKETFIIDGHNDLPYNLYNLEQNNLDKFHFDKNLKDDPKWGSKNCDSCFTDLPRLREGKVGGQFWVAYVSCQTQYKDAMAKTFEQIDVIKRLVNKYPDDLQFVTKSDDIKKAFDEGKIASMIGVEGGHSIDSRLGVLRMQYELGVRYMTLTHSCSTPWADNSYVDDTQPVHNLTEYGRVVVKEMNRLGMMIDLSHVSHAVMNQAIETSNAPVIFSHSSAYSVYAHNRNVRDDTLKLVTKNNGIVMVNFYPGFISSNTSAASIQDVANHINHIVDIAGIDHVGIGADYDGVSQQPIGLEDVSKYPSLFNLLEEQNASRWTEENLKKLAFVNFVRVFKQVEQVSASMAEVSPAQQWIAFEDLDTVDERTQLWQCRTLLNNTSPEITEKPSAPGHATRLTNLPLVFILSILLIKSLL